MLRVLLPALVAGFVVSQVANFCTTVYLHRTLTHRAMTVHPVVGGTFRTLLWITTGIRPRQWVAVHRKHHAHTDEPADPHSPKQLGWLKVQLGNVGLYRRVANDPTQVARYARDLPADRWDRWFLDRAWLGLGIGIAVLVVAFGPAVGLLAAGLHTAIYLGMSASVNAVGHTFGRRPHDNSATNVRWLAALTAGEGWHNNHHAAPTSAKFSFRRGEIDLAWPFISFLRRVKLATVRPVGPAKPAEPPVLGPAVR